MKKLLIIILILTSSIVYGEEYFVKDQIKGSNMDLLEFQDPISFNLIDDLVYNDQIKKHTNLFKGIFSYGYDDYDDYFGAKDLKFKGKVTFNDKSQLEYEFIDFELEETNVDEWGTTEAWGNGVFHYKLVVVIEEFIPVEAGFSFYQDIEDKDNFHQYVYFQGDDLGIEFEGNQKQKFKHRRQCSGDCY